MRKIKEINNPIWQDLETKDRIIAKFVYEDGGSAVMAFPVDENNSDYAAFMEFHSHDTVDSFTQEVRAKQTEERAKVIAINEEKTREKRANLLFNAKIEAFEVDAVKNADKGWKSRIRKAKTTVEVLAIVSMLIMQEGLTPDVSATDADNSNTI
jgi:hypothetical protein